MGFGGGHGLAPINKPSLPSRVNMERSFYGPLRFAPVATASAIATQNVAASERKPA